MTEQRKKCVKVACLAALYLWCCWMAYGESRRYFSAKFGRWTQQDRLVCGALSCGGPMSLASITLYVWSREPSGLEEWWDAPADW